MGSAAKHTYRVAVIHAGPGRVGLKNQVNILSERLGTVVNSHYWLDRSSDWLPSFLDECLSNQVDLLITAGRKCGALSIEAKQRLPSTIKRLHFEYPRQALTEFDLVVCPTHDLVHNPDSSDNSDNSDMAHVISYTAGLTSETNTSISSTDPSLVTICLGGSNSAFKFNSSTARVLAQQLAQCLPVHNCKLQITGSGRTDNNAFTTFIDTLDTIGCEISDYYHPRLTATKSNPYREYLESASLILVTGDSSAMLADAASYGKPLWIVPLPNKILTTILPANTRKKWQRLHTELAAKGHAKIWQNPGKIEPFPAIPLRQIENIISNIHKRLGVSNDTLSTTTS